MTIQDFRVYTMKGYEGDLVDSGPRVVQTGVLLSTNVGYGKAVQRKAGVERGIVMGSPENVFALTQRVLNHEAGTRPSTGEDFKYLKNESVSLIRQGFIYLKAGAATVAGEKMWMNGSSGKFGGTATATGFDLQTVNVTAEETVAVGEIFKARIDIVA